MECCFLKVNRLTVLVKPASGLCQMSCKYCFYKEMKSCGAQPGMIMTKTVVDSLILMIKARLSPTGIVTIAFQGGEPLLAGIEFYNYFFNAVLIHNINAQYIFQTNGICISDDINGEKWIDLFKKYNCIIGLSVDGDASSHNTNRIFNNGAPTHTLVMKAYRRMIDAGICVNFLTVLSKSVLNSPSKLYNFYKRSNVEYVQLIPCLPPIGENDTIDRDILADFLMNFYNYWIDDYRKNSCPPFEVREFSAIINALQGNISDPCVFSGKCNAQLVIESDGSIYPCDFYVLPEYCTGNVIDTSIDDTLCSSGIKKFITDKPKLADQCKACRYLSACNGGCRRMQDVWRPDIDGCPMKKFINHILNE